MCRSLSAPGLLLCISPLLALLGSPAMSALAPLLGIERTCDFMSTRPNTTLADFLRARDSQITFSVTHGWSAFWSGRPWLVGHRIGETSSDVGSSRFWIGWVTKHGDNVPALRVGADRSWRPQERSADGEAACARRMRSIASLHCGRGLGRNACGNRTTRTSRQ